MTWLPSTRPSQPHTSPSNPSCPGGRAPVGEEVRGSDVRVVHRAVQAQITNIGEFNESADRRQGKAAFRNRKPLGVRTAKLVPHEM